MPDKEMTDRQFLDTLEHHFHANYLPPFGDSSFFNSGLFYYIVHEAAENLPHLDSEMEKLRNRFGTDTHKIKMRVYSDPPTIGIKLYTPSGCRKLKITDGDIVVRPMSPDQFGKD